MSYQDYKYLVIEILDHNEQVNIKQYFDSCNAFIAEGAVGDGIFVHWQV
jgi:hypothetical protein